MMLGGMLKCYWVIEMESVVFVQILFSIIVGTKYKNSGPEITWAHNLFVVG